ncbi:MAG: TRAP transporter substrate-binding protein DctP [Propioniciclava sp.]
MKALKKIAATATVAATALALAACGGGISSTGGGGSAPGGARGAGDADVVLRYSTQHTDNTPFSRATQRWAELVNERTEGRVAVEIYYSASLLPAAEVLPGIIDGRAETGFVVDTMFPDMLPLTNASSIPFDRTNGVAQAKAYQELYTSNPDFKAEFDALGVHVLMFQPSGASSLGSIGEISSLDDLQGKSIRCLGYICDALQGVGANPVAIASNEIYEAMDRDTIDGWAAYPFMDMVATQFQEVTPYVTDPGIGTYIQPFSPINLDTWESLSPEDQQVLTDLGAEYADIMAEEMNALEEETCTATTEAEVKLSTMSEADIATWRDTVHEGIYDTWVADAEGKTELDPAAFYTDLTAAYETALAETDFESQYAACEAKG